MINLEKLNLKKGENLGVLFGENARETAQILNDGQRAKVSTTQFRKFYDKVAEILDEAEGINFSDKSKELYEFRTTILPQLILLRSRANYSKERKVATEELVQLFKNEVTNIEELRHFKLFLESVVGYMPKK